MPTEIEPMGVGYLDDLVALLKYDDTQRRKIFAERDKAAQKQAQSTKGRRR